MAGGCKNYVTQQVTKKLPHKYTKYRRISKLEEKDYSCQNAKRNKAGGGSPPMPLDPLSASVLPLLEEELNPLTNICDNDHGHHGGFLVENADGSVKYCVTGGALHPTGSSSLASAPQQSSCQCGTASVSTAEGPLAKEEAGSRCKEGVFGVGSRKTPAKYGCK
ncbi:uncharacterized protein LOC143037990 isoform X1 [Oratosquilla oratoria]|uniref:uncharacterized protein LOC143037990 isoform X1 n=1 Tax=Oratosquilla oratoria TaxID=337810 RepID=UPI003F7767C1